MTTRQTLTTTAGRLRLLRSTHQYIREQYAPVPYDEGVDAVAAHLRSVGVPITDASMADYFDASEVLWLLDNEGADGGRMAMERTGYGTVLAAEEYARDMVASIEAEAIATTNGGTTNA